MSNLEKFSYNPKSKKEIIKNEIGEGIKEYNESKNEAAGEVEEGAEQIPYELINTEQFKEKHGDDIIDDLYEWYEKAMGRRDREPLEKDRFIYYFFGGGSSDKSYMYGDSKKGYLLGAYKHDIFIPTYFAPKSIRKGYELFKELGASETPTVLLITDDLAKTLSKMPEWKIEDFEIPAVFRGELAKKMIAHNKFPGYKESLLNMAEEYFSSSRGEYDEDDHEEAA